MNSDAEQDAEGQLGWFHVKGYATFGYCLAPTTGGCGCSIGAASLCQAVPSK